MRILKRLLLVAIVTGSSLQHSFAQSSLKGGPIIFSGAIKNLKPSADGIKSITLNYPKELRISPIRIKLNDDDTFQKDIYGPEGIYTISDGNFPYNLYFRPGHKSTIQYNFNVNGILLAGDVDLSGTDTNINRYFIIKHQEKTFFDPSENKTETEYSMLLANWKLCEFERIQHFQLPEFVSSKERKDINYEYLLNLFLYTRYNEMRDSSFQASQKTVKQFNIEYCNEKDYEIYGNYKSLVYEYYLKKLEDINIDSLKTNSAFNLRQNRVRIINQIVPSDYIKNDIISRMVLYDLKTVNNIETYYKDFTTYYTGNNEKIKEEALDSYLRLTKLKIGTPSPNFFNYLNYKGGTKSLNDFKGKYVFIDIWATWCGNCWSEFPYIRKMEERFKDKNIVFLSISMDNEKEKWAKTIEEEKLPGIQLLSNGIKDQFFVEYAVYGIPRYILIDPEQNIINFNMPRPSEEETITGLFKSLGIE